MINFILWHIIKGKLKSYRSIGKALLTLLFIVIAGFYGFLASKFGGGPAAENHETAEMFNKIIAVAIFSMGAFRIIIPSYNPMKRVLSPIYPASKLQRYLLPLLTEFFTSFFFYTFIFLTTAFVFMGIGGWKFFVYGSLGALSGHLLKRTIQYGIDFRLSKEGYLLYFSAIAALVLSFVFPAFISVATDYIFILFPTFLLVAGYFLQASIKESKESSFNFSIRGLGSSGIYLKMLLNRSEVRIQLAIALGIKVGWFALQFFTDNLSGKEPFIIVLVASCIMLYSSIFNNIWGFLKQAWLNMEIRSGNYSDLIKTGLKIQFFPVLADMIITLPFLLLIWDYIFVLAFDFVILLFLCCSSFFWSILLPMHVNSGFQMKGATHFVANIITIGSVFLLSLIQYHPWLYLIIILYLFFSFVVIKLALDMYKDKKYSMYLKFMKS
jgi:hypothetical protein